MRPISYPPAIKTYFKAVPAYLMVYYLVHSHPITQWNIQHHSNERILNVYFKSRPVCKYQRRRDEVLRNYYKEACEWQPAEDPEFRRPPMFQYFGRIMTADKLLKIKKYILFFI